MSEHLTDPKYSDKDALAIEGIFFVTGLMEPNTARDLCAGLLRFSEQCAAMEQKPPVALFINSGGGEVNAGLMIGALLMLLKSRGHRIDTYITGRAESMAVVLAQYGDTRFCDACAQILVHSASFCPGYGDVVYHAEMFQGLKRINTTIAAIMASRNTAGLNEVNWWLDNALNGHEHYYLAPEAQQMGLVDKLMGGAPTPPQEKRGDA